MHASRATYVRKHWGGVSDSASALRLELERHLGEDQPVLICGEEGSGRKYAAQLINGFVNPPARWRVITPGDVTQFSSPQLHENILLREIEAFTVNEQDMIVASLTAPGRVIGRIFATSRLTSTHAMESGFLHEGLRKIFSRNILEIPPLRMRDKDIPDLCRRWEASPLLFGRRFSPDALAWCQKRPWPGNTLQLRHVAEQAARLCKDNELTPALLVQSEAQRNAACPRATLTMDELVTRYVDLLLADGREVADIHDRVIAEVERPLLQRIMEATGGNQLRAARILGLNRNTLRKKLKMFQIMPGRS